MRARHSQLSSFDIDTSEEDVNIHPEMFCMHSHLKKIAPPPVLLCEPSPPLASVNNQLMLKELKCEVSSNILSQPLELQCGALVCTKCLQEWIAASGAVNCPCCSEGGPLVSSCVRTSTRGPDRTSTWKCALTTSAVSHQAVLEKMHKSSLTASQYLFLTSSFHRHCKGGFPCSKETLKLAQHSQEVLQHVALVHGEENPLAVDLLKHSAAKKKPVKAIIIQHAQLYSTDWSKYQAKSIKLGMNQFSPLVFQKAKASMPDEFNLSHPKNLKLYNTFVGTGRDGSLQQLCSLPLLLRCK
eukprot:Em0015g531a